MQKGVSIKPKIESIDFTGTEDGTQKEIKERFYVKE